MNNIQELIPAGTEVLRLTDSPVMAVMNTVEDTTGIFDEEGQISPIPVPGHPDMKYIPWGINNKLPYEIMRLVGGDEVTSANKLFNVMTSYGAGIEMREPGTDYPTKDKKINSWIRKQFLPKYFLNQITDMKYFYFSVAVIILTRDHSSIAKIVHKEACYCRFEPADKMGKIKHVFFYNWRDRSILNDQAAEVIPLLDEDDPFGDLMVRMGKESDEEGKCINTIDGKDCKFAVVMKYPTAGCQYYPIPYWISIFKGGSYDEKRLISTGKRAKLRNSASVKYQVNIARDYWQRICQEEGISDLEKCKARIKKEKENIRDFIGGIENSGKVWISGFMVDPMKGTEIKDIIIDKIDTGKEGGDWAEDTQVATNTVCYADGIHTNLVGATPGKSQSNNSGSDKRELFTIKQALEKSWHDLLLMPLYLIAWYNDWNVEPVVPFLMLTTLDEHTDAKKVSNNQTEEDDDTEN
jgi:hypothetical protein